AGNASAETLARPDHNATRERSWIMDQKHHTEQRKHELVAGIEYTREALIVARAFMDLPGNERDAIRLHVINAAAKYNEKITNRGATVLRPTWPASPEA